MIYSRGWRAADCPRDRVTRRGTSRRTTTFFQRRASNKPDETNTPISSGRCTSFRYFELSFSLAVFFPSLSLSSPRSSLFFFSLLGSAVTPSSSRPIRISSARAARISTTMTARTAASCAVFGESAKKPHADREPGPAEDFQAINRRAVCAETRTITGWPLSEKRGKHARCFDRSCFRHPIFLRRYRSRVRN